MTNLDSKLKNKDITLPQSSQRSGRFFSHPVMYGCESWIKRVDHQRIDTSEL